MACLLGAFELLQDGGLERLGLLQQVAMLLQELVVLQGDGRAADALQDVLVVVVVSLQGTSVNAR